MTSLECPLCGSTNVKVIGGEYDTGVVAPDGYRERWYEEGLKCLDCGCVSDESEFEVQRPDWETSAVMRKYFDDHSVLGVPQVVHAPRLGRGV